jgi:hypothetical protein
MKEQNIGKKKRRKRGKGRGNRERKMKETSIRKVLGSNLGRDINHH